MKQPWLFIKYYYTWQPVIPIVVALGVLLFMLKIVFTNTTPAVTFFLGLGAFAFLLVVPFCSASTALRHLIANPHLAIVPGLKLQAGIAHLVIAIAASIYLYVNFLIFAPDDYTPLVMARTFIGLSAYAGFMQLILPSRYFVSIISLAPVVLVMISIQFRDLLGALFLDTGITIALFVVAIAGWGRALHTLATNSKFKPANTCLYTTEAWASYDGGILTRLPIGRSSTAEGTLLLGYPDNWGGIVLRVAYYFILTPLFTTGAMYFIGIVDDMDQPMPEKLIRLFLFISLFSGIFCIYIYGELVARARLVWLRFGTDRSTQWRLVDSYSLRFLLVYYLCGVIIAFLARLLTDINPVYLLHYQLLIISYCCFNLYFALLVRASRLSSLVFVLVLVMNLVALIFGVMRAFRDVQPSFDLLIVIEFLLLTLGIACRQRVKQLFDVIDWRQVSINKYPGRMALTQE